MIPGRAIQIKEDQMYLECPYCHGVTVEWTEDLKLTIRECEHLLFVANDREFEYASNRYLERLGRRQEDLPVGGDMDDFTSDAIFGRFMKFWKQVGGTCYYFGFAPDGV
jgi:hypothetical protein